MNIESGNKLIADFVNYWKDDEDKIGTYYERRYYYTKGLMKYHSSWDWLHPVYRKTAEIGLWMMTNGSDKLWLEKSGEIDRAMLNEGTPAKAARLIANLIQWHTLYLSTKEQSK